MSAAASGRFEAIVIGAGSGGLTVAVGLARAGRRVALVEAADVGGDCTNTGCIPSKTLITLAQRVAALPHSERADAARAALAETRQQRDALRAHEEAWLADTANLELLRGHARLRPSQQRAGAIEVEVERDGAARVLQAPRIVLASGASATLPDVAGLAEATAAADPWVRTSATVFDLSAAPAQLAIIGGGASGCELAFAFARLGSQVSVIEAADRLLPASEAAASELVRSRLERLGVRVLTDTRLRSLDSARRRLELESVAAASGSAPAPLDGVERVLVATGRRPNSDDLGLDSVGVRRDGRGAVIVDGAYRTTRAGVYAIGDVTGAAFTHVANAQGRRLVRWLLLPLPLISEGDAPSVAFTEPEVGQIGPTLAQLRRRWPDPLLAVHKVALAGTDRGRTSGLEDGFVQLVAMRVTGRLLAATVVAPHASEMLPLLSWAQRRRVSLWQLSRLVVAYPALSEAIRMAADAFVFSSLPALPRELGTYLRWRWRRGPRG